MSTTVESRGTYTDLKHKIDPHQINVPDPTVEGVEVVSRYPWNGGKYTNGRLAWGEQHDICSEFLPFAYLDDNPLEVLKEIGEFLNSRPATRQRVTTSELYSRASFSRRDPGPVIFGTLCLVFGWWRGGETPASGPYYCNPDYVHTHPESDYIDPRTYWDDEAGEYVNARFDFALRAARVGQPGPLVSQAFGLENDGSASRWFHRRNFDWGAKYEAGRERMARTWKTIHAWGYSYEEIARAFNSAESTVSGRVRREAADYEPPGDPSYRVVSAGGDGQ